MNGQRIIHYSMERGMKNEVGGACGTYGRREKSVQYFGGKDRRKEATWKTKEQVVRWGQNGS
jgi:hypothetical protein